jgi:hypothetical protein
MRRTWNGLGWLVALFGLAGCWTSKSHLRPPPNPEEFRPPPLTDTRFSNPPTYPPGTLETGTLKKRQDSADAPGFRTPSFRTPGAGGMGGGY